MFSHSATMHLTQAESRINSFIPANTLVKISLVSSPCKTGWPVPDHFIIVLLQPQSVLCRYPGHEADGIRGHHGVQACAKIYLDILLDIDS